MIFSLQLYVAVFNAQSTYYYIQTSNDVKAAWFPSLLLLNGSSVGWKQKPVPSNDTLKLPWANKNAEKHKMELSQVN